MKLQSISQWLCQAIMLSVATVAAPTFAAAADKTNPHVVRQASGTYAYTTLSDGEARGVEKFQLLTHRDGSRTLMMWHDLWAKDAQFTVVLRVDKAFRPQSAYASYWVAGGYKGNTLFQVSGDTLTANGQGAEGPVAQTLAVPEQFSIGTHPVAGDGWHLWYVPTEGPADGKLNLFSLEATADAGKPVLGQLVEMPYEVIGEEVVETPAGRFDTVHYRLMGASDLWVTGADRMLVKMVQPRFDRQYLLVELDAG